MQKYGIRKVGIPALTVSCCVFQARNIKTGELAAVKIIKLEPGKRNLCPARPQTTSVIVLWLRGSGVWPTDRDPDYWGCDESFTPSDQTERSWRGGLAIFCNILSALVLFWNRLFTGQMHSTCRRQNSVCVCASVCVWGKIRKNTSLFLIYIDGFFEQM